MAPQTADSDAPPFAQPGRTRDHSRPNPVCIEIPVTVQGSRNSQASVGSAAPAQPFVEQTRTVLALEQGAVIRLTEPVAVGQILILKNVRLNREAACRVVNSKAPGNAKGYVEAEFLGPEPGFWGIEFPSAPVARPVAEVEPQLKPPESRLSTTTGVLQSQPMSPRGQTAGVPLLPDLLPTESQTSLISSREPSPSSLFGFDQGVAELTASKHSTAATPTVERDPRRTGQQSSALGDSASLSGLLDSLTPLGEQVLLGKGPGSQSSNLKKTPIPGALPSTSVPMHAEMPVDRKSQDYSLQVPAEALGSYASPRISPGAAIDFEHPSFSGDLSFTTPGRSGQGAALGGPIFSPGDTEPTVSSSGRSRSFLVGVAIVLVVASVGGLGYYRWASRPHAAPPVAQVAPPPRPSPHDVTAPVDTSADTDNTSTSDNGSDDEGAPSSMPPAPSPQAASIGGIPASSPVRTSTTHSTPPAATPKQNSATAPPADSNPSPTAPHVQAPPDMRMSSPNANPSGRNSALEAPNLSGDVPSALPDGQANGLGGISQSDSQPAPPPQASTSFHQAELISSVAPEYPDSARNQGIQGDVVVDLQIDDTGKVARAQIVSGPSQLRDAALDALRKRKYKPATMDGKPISTHVIVTIHFRAQQ